MSLSVQKIYVIDISVNIENFHHIKKFGISWV